MSERRPFRVALVGAWRAGKSRGILRAAAALRLEGLAVGGLAQPSEMEGERVLGYDLLADGTIDYAYGPNQLDNVQASDPDAPPQHETPYDWGFARQTAEPFQGDPWIRFDEALGGSVYELDASSRSFDFLGSDTEEESALFVGDGGPAPGSVVAAYYADGQVFLVAP